MKSRKSIREKSNCIVPCSFLVCTMMQFTFDDTATGFRGGQAQAALVGSPAVQEQTAGMLCIWTAHLITSLL